MKSQRVGFAFCGSFCTHKEVLKELEAVCREYETVLPIVSQACQTTDTRFGKAEDFLAEVERLSGHTVIGTIQAAEPIGPKKLLDVLVIAPCTGNTLAKLAAGVTDTPVTMAGCQGPPAQRPARSGRRGHQRRAQRGGQEHRGTAGKEELLLCTFRSG